MQIIVEKTVVLTYDSRIIVKKIAGEAYPLNLKEWEVKSISTGHGRHVEFIEAWV